ncbi:MAG: outer membrane protein assembly factor BamA, partial [Myxococcales bacterium]|nr:outer membrane protein assembly factor BamA [Myxococcales bacterium]
MMNATKLLRSVVLALAIVLAAPFAGVAGTFFGAEAAQAQTIQSISVSGNQRVDRGTIVSRLAVGVGDVATAAKLSASTVNLESTGLFSKVSVTFGGGVLRVVVSENAIVASVLFEGNQRFTDANLLAMVEVADRGSFTQDRLQRDIGSIESAYQQVGYRDVTVTTRVEPVDGGRMRVTFVIDEGQKSGIAGINFTGNASIGSGTLKGVMSLHETNLLSWLVKDDNYTDEAAAADAEAIRIYYGNHGFPDAQVSYVAEFDPSRNGYFVNYTVVEGERYQFGTVGIETSIPGLDADVLRSTIQTQQGGRYSLKDLQETADDMAIEATAQGYPFADVRPRIDRDINGHIFNVTYLVDEGPRVYVKRIEITGNDKTRDFVIRRELEFAEGDPFNRAMVVRGKQNIEKLGYFSKVRFDVQPGSAPDKVILSIDVTEQSTGDYGLTAGYSTTEGVLGEVSLTERNFLGRGQYLRISVGASQAGRTFDLSFTEPRFMGLKISSGIDVYNRITDETATGFYGTTATGGQVRIGLPVTRDLTTTLFTGLEYKTIADASAPFSGVVTNGQAFTKA